MKLYNNPANSNMTQVSEQQNMNPETLKENNLESGRSELQNNNQIQAKKVKRPRIQRPVYSAKLV